jgi:hypothetical protein
MMIGVNHESTSPSVRGEMINQEEAVGGKTVQFSGGDNLAEQQNHHGDDAADDDEDAENENVDGGDRNGGGVLGKICSEELGKVMTMKEGGGGPAAVPGAASKAAGKPELPSFSTFSKPQDIAPMITLKNPNKRTYVPSSTAAPTTASKASQYPCPYEGSCKVADECRSNAGRCGLFPTRLAETYYGYIETVEDAVMIVEACRHGRLMRVKRRLHEKERQGIRSGSVFVFVERESGIRRWTDGKVWSPSRICGEFLLYRELETRQPPAKKSAVTQINWSEQVAKILSERAKSSAAGSSQSSSSLSVSPVDEEARGPVFSPESYEPLNKIVKFIAEDSGNDASHPSKASQMVFKKDGLIKKTISLTVADETYHLICYFKDSNLGTELLPLTPCRSAQFKNLEVCRNPVSYPIMMIQQQPQIQVQPQNGNGYYPAKAVPAPRNTAPQMQQPQQMQHQQQQYISASSLMYPGYPLMQPMQMQYAMHPAQHHQQQQHQQQQQQQQYMQLNGAKAYQYAAAQFYQKQAYPPQPQFPPQPYYGSKTAQPPQHASSCQQHSCGSDDIESDAVGCANCPSARSCNGATHQAASLPPVERECEPQRKQPSSMSLATLTSPKADLDEAQLLFCFLDAVQPAAAPSNPQ